MREILKNFAVTILALIILPLVMFAACSYKNISGATQTRITDNYDSGQNTGTDDEDAADIIDNNDSSDQDTQPVEDKDSAQPEEEKKEQTEESKPVAAQPAETFYNDMYAVSLVNLNVRSAPTTESAVLGQLEKEQSAQLISYLDSGWYKINFKGKTAFISANASYSAKVKANDYRVISDRIIAEGMKILGTPYEFGAQRLLYSNGKPNPAFTGKTFDCSSFVQYVYYKGAGIKLQMDSRSQSLEGKEVSKANLRKGDLLFMYSTARQYNTGLERIGHVAMYIGNNRILHTFGTGGVRIQDYSAFWQERTLVIKRMF